MAQMNDCGAAAIVSPFGPWKPIVTGRSGAAIGRWLVGSARVNTSRLSPMRNPVEIWTGRKAAAEAAGLDGDAVGDALEPQAAANIASRPSATTGRDRGITAVA